MNKVDALFAGTIRTLEPEGQRTGIYKQVISVARVSREGIDGDQQADRRFHGGPEKALHQFAHSSYETIITTYPELEGVAIVGSIGENISVKDMADSTVCIGDIYRMGEVTLQVSQPRNPCWKINHRFNIDTLSLFIEKQHISGWYYRVLECGKMELGDEVVLLERPGNDMSIARFSKSPGTIAPISRNLSLLQTARVFARNYSNALSSVLTTLVTWQGIDSGSWNEMLIKQPLREALFILTLLTCHQLAAEELVLPDGSTARTPDERLQFLRSFLALKIKRDLVDGNIESALEYFQEIIDERSAAIGHDFEEAMKPKEEEEQKIWEYGGKK